MRLLKDCVMDLRKSTAGRRTCLMDNAREDACEAITLGSIIKSLSEHELQFIWGGSSSSIYLQSFKQLTSVVQQIKVVRNYDNHERCNPVPAIVKKIQRLGDQMRSPVTQEHISHLSRQRDKTGL
jgi:hypothetical protein